jgi:hypothetical protein
VNTPSRITTPLAQRIAHGKHRIVERRRRPDLEFADPLGLSAKRELDEVLAIREFPHLVDIVDIAGRIAQRRRPELAAGAELKHVTGGEVAIAANGKRGADRAVLIDALLVGNQLQWQRPVIGDRAIVRLFLHHFEGGGADALLHTGFQRGRADIGAERESEREPEKYRNSPQQGDAGHD